LDIGHVQLTARLRLASGNVHRDADVGQGHGQSGAQVDDGVFAGGGSAADAAPWTGDQGVIACAHLAIDARLCIDAGEVPGMPTGIAGRTDGGWIGEGVGRMPLAPIRDALGALVPPRP
jgi:hypothetical protein